MGYSLSLTSKNQHQTLSITPKYVTSSETHLRDIAPRQHSYLHRCLSSEKLLAKLVQIRPI